MRKLLTERGLRALKPRPKQFTIWDSLIPPFGVRVSATGRKAFIVMRRPAGSTRPIRVTLGHYPALSLEQARTEASVALAELVAGKRPRQERQRRQDEQREIEETTFAAVAKRYLGHIGKRRTFTAIEQLVERELVSRWGDRPIASISRREIIGAVEAVRDSKRRKGRRTLGGPAAAWKVFTYTSRIFRFAVARDLLEHSPADHVSATELLGKKKVRQRTLSDSEIKALWQATEWSTDESVEIHERGRWPLAPFVRLLLLLGVRRGELAAARWGQIDLDRGTWLIPAEHSKTAEPHLVPLPAEAVRILRSLQQFVGGDLVFTMDGRRGLAAWTAIKRALDALTKLDSYTFHDLRRTARSNWSALGVAPHIAEQMLGHKAPGIIPVYDTHRYEHERRAALELWSRRIAEIVAPPPASPKVIPIPLRA
jgi:integrase